MNALVATRQTCPSIIVEAPELAPKCNSTCEEGRNNDLMPELPVIAANTSVLITSSARTTGVLPETVNHCGKSFRGSEELDVDDTEIGPLTG